MENFMVAAEKEAVLKEVWERAVLGEAYQASVSGVEEGLVKGVLGFGLVVKGIDRDA